MVAGRKPVIIHYRKYDRLPAEKLTLEALVRNGMNSIKQDGAAIKDRYLSRLRNVGSDSFFINTYHDVLSGESMVFGDILHFTKGHLQALCKTADETAASVPVQQMKAPEQTEYVHSQLFWMIKEDHVFVIQSLSLRTPDLEEYLDWLLKQNAKVLTSANPLILKANVKCFRHPCYCISRSSFREVVTYGPRTILFVNKKTWFCTI